MTRGHKRPHVNWGLLAFTTVSACAAGGPLQAQSPPRSPSAQGAPGLPTVQRMLEPGAEVQQLAREVGTWDVTMTIRPTAEATPIVVSGPGTEVTVYFDNFPNPGLGDVGGGVRARHVDTRESDDHTFKRQYWTRPGEPECLAIQYEYTRRR